MQFMALQLTNKEAVINLGTGSSIEKGQLFILGAHISLRSKQGPVIILCDFRGLD